MGNPLSGIHRTIDQWFNPQAFAPPPVGRFGHASPNSIEGYPVKVQHLSMAKFFPITRPDADA